MDFSKGSVYIYIYRVYSTKVAMSSRPIGFPGTRYNKRLVCTSPPPWPEHPFSPVSNLFRFRPGTERFVRILVAGEPTT